MSGEMLRKGQDGIFGCYSTKFYNLYIDIAASKATPSKVVKANVESLT